MASRFASVRFASPTILHAPRRACRARTTVRARRRRPGNERLVDSQRRGVARALCRAARHRGRCGHDRRRPLHGDRCAGARLPRAARQRPRRDASIRNRVDAFTPLALNAHERTTAGEHDYAVITLLRAGTTLDQLRTQLDGSTARTSSNSVAVRAIKADRVAVLPLQAQVVGSAQQPLLLLLGAVSAVLLIVCVNLANLLLARSTTRRRESAVRIALGASRGRIVRQALTETLALGLIGGAVGVVLSRWGLRLLLAFAPANLPRTLRDSNRRSRTRDFACCCRRSSGSPLGSFPRCVLAARHPARRSRRRLAVRPTDGAASVCERCSSHRRSDCAPCCSSAAECSFRVS